MPGSRTSPLSSSMLWPCENSSFLHDLGDARARRQRLAVDGAARRRPPRSRRAIALEWMKSTITPARPPRTSARRARRSRSGCGTGSVYQCTGSMVKLSPPCLPIVDGARIGVGRAAVGADHRLAPGRDCRPLRAAERGARAGSLVERALLHDARRGRRRHQDRGGAADSDVERAPRIERCRRAAARRRRAPADRENARHRHVPPCLSRSVSIAAPRECRRRKIGALRRPPQMTTVMNPVCRVDAGAQDGARGAASRSSMRRTATICGALRVR